MLKTLHRKLIGDLRAQRGSFLAVWIVVVLGAAFYGAFYPAGQNVLQAVEAVYTRYAYMDYLAQFDPAPAALAGEVRALPGVAAADGRLVVEGGIRLDPARATLTALRLVSLAAGGEDTVNLNQVAEGRAISAPGEILLVKRFADYHALRPGDRVQVWLAGQPHDFTIAGLVFNPEYLVLGRSREASFPAPSAFGAAWIGYDDLAGLIGAPGLINQIVVRAAARGGREIPQLAPGAPFPELPLRQQLLDLLGEQPGLLLQHRSETASGGIIQANVNGNFQTMAMFSGLFLAVVVAVSSLLLGRLVEGERQRIGTLRALGVRRSEVVRHYLSFGLLIGLSGGLLGSLLGYLASFSVMLPYVDAIAGGYLPGFRNLPQLPFILLGWGVIVLATTLAGAYPAWVESGVEPGIALRPPAPRTPGALSRLRLAFLPLELRRALRDILRSPGRAAATLLGVMLGTLMLFAALGLLNSMDFSFGDYFAANRYDLRLVAQPGPAAALQASLAGVPGVEAAQAALFGPLRVLSDQAQPFDTVAFVLDERAPFIELTTLQGAPAFSSSQGVWVGHNLARVLELHPGDTLRLEALGQVRQARLLGVVSQAFGSPVFVPRSLFAAWSPDGQAPANIGLLRVAPDRLDEVREALASVPGVVAVEDYPAYVRDLKAYLSFWQFSGAFFALCGLLLTLAVVLNTISASLHEQQADLAIRRSLGAGRGEITRSVLLELLLLALPGMALGALAGRQAGFVMAHSVDMDFYGLVGVLYPASIPAALLLVLAVVLLAAWRGLRGVFRQDLGAVSKGQSL